MTMCPGAPSLFMAMQNQPPISPLFMTGVSVAIAAILIAIRIRKTWKQTSGNLEMGKLCQQCLSILSSAFGIPLSVVLFLAVFDVRYFELIKTSAGFQLIAGGFVVILYSVASIRDSLK